MSAAPKAKGASANAAMFAEVKASIESAFADLLREVERRLIESAGGSSASAASASAAAAASPPPPALGPAGGGGGAGSTSGNYSMSGGGGNNNVAGGSSGGGGAAAAAANASFMANGGFGDITSIVRTARWVLEQQRTRRPRAKGSGSAAAAGGGAASSSNYVWHSGAVWSVILSSFYLGRKKCSDLALTLVQLILRLKPLPFHLMTDVFFPRGHVLATGSSSSGGGGARAGAATAAVAVGSKAGTKMTIPASVQRGNCLHCAVAEGLYLSLAECLINATDHALQTRVLALLTRMLEQLPATHAYFTGRCVRRMLYACFTTILRSGQAEVRAAAERLQHLAARCVTAEFVLNAVACADAPPGAAAHASAPSPSSSSSSAAAGASGPGSGAGGRNKGGTSGALLRRFATDTPLRSYVTDVDYDDPFTEIHVVDCADALAAAAAGAAAGAADTTPPAKGPHAASGASPHTPQRTTAQSNNNNSADDVEKIAPLPSFPPDEHQQQQQQQPLPPFTATASAAAAAAAAAVAGERQYNPHALYPHSWEDYTVREAVSVVGPEGHLPPPLRDMLLAVRNTARVAARPCKGAPLETNPEVQVRLLSLRVLERMLLDLPSANSGDEHVCATWLSVVFTACRYDLLHCLAVNLATASPFAFFHHAIRILALLLRKVHYVLARELHTLLHVMVFPLTLGPRADFRQKHAVLNMILQIFSVPHVVVSMFINYDCNPAFDAAGAGGGGMLQLMVDYVTEIAFADLADAGDAGDGGDGGELPWLTSNQQQLLRSEALVVINALLLSMHRWISEDPKVYAVRALNRKLAGGGGGGGGSGSANGRQASGAGAGTGAAAPAAAEWEAAELERLDQLREMYLDNWDLSEEEEEEDEQEDVHEDNTAEAEGGGVAATPGQPKRRRSRAGQTESSLPSGLLAVNSQGQPTVVLGRHRNICYHWRHVHHLLQNKTIAQDAVALINEGKWQAAKSLLEERDYIQRSGNSGGDSNNRRGQNASPSASGVVGTAGAHEEYGNTDDTNRNNGNGGGGGGEEEEEASGGGDPEPGTTAYAHFARFLHAYPGIRREAISGIFERVNKADPAPRLLLLEYLHLFHYHSVPIDIALRNTTCKFMSFDRPMFEAQVWETIAALFGAEYARQNPDVITAKDADTMTSVLLFLHTNVHNEQAAKTNCISAAQFAADGNACLDFPMPEEDMRAMYHRVQRRKWELDEYGRTPQEAEAEARLQPTASRIRQQLLLNAITQEQQQMQARKGSQGQEGKQQEEEKGAAAGGAEHKGERALALQQREYLQYQNAHRTSPPSSPPPGSPTSVTSSSSSPTGKGPKGLLAEVDPHVLEAALQESSAAGAAAANGSRRTTGGSGVAAAASARPIPPAAPARQPQHLSSDIALLDAGTPRYPLEDELKWREAHHTAYAAAAAQRVAALERAHRALNGGRDSYHPQPYLLPHYAQHVRPLLLLLCPQILACVYLGFRVMEEAPSLRQLHHSVSVLLDIAAAFGVSLSDLHSAADTVIAHYLSSDSAYRLPPLARMSFVSYLLTGMA